MNTAVITGAASGLGRAIANYYAKQGWQIIVVDIQEQASNEVVNEIIGNGGKAYFFNCDVAKSENFTALASFTKATTGQCNLLVNCAGVASSGALMDTDEDEWHRLISLDLMSCVHGSKAFIPLLRESASPSSTNAIVNVASFAGIALMPGMITYNVAKAGVIAFTESLRCELKKEHIHVAAACPSFFKTNLTSSMTSSDPATIERINKWMENSPLTAESVAADIARGILNKETLIISDKKVKKYLRIIGWIYSKILRK